MALVAVFTSVGQASALNSACTADADGSFNEGYSLSSGVPVSETVCGGERFYHYLDLSELLFADSIELTITADDTSQGSLYYYADYIGSAYDDVADEWGIDSTNSETMIGFDWNTFEFAEVTGTITLSLPDDISITNLSPKSDLFITLFSDEITGVDYTVEVTVDGELTAEADFSLENDSFNPETGIFRYYVANDATSDIDLPAGYRLAVHNRLYPVNADGSLDKAGVIHLISRYPARNPASGSARQTTTILASSSVKSGVRVDLSSLSDGDYRVVASLVVRGPENVIYSFDENREAFEAMFDRDARYNSNYATADFSVSSGVASLR